MKLKSKALSVLWDLLVITAAALAYAIGFNWFYKPNNIGFGGLTGVAQILNAIFPWLPIGVTVLVLNVPLFLLGWKLFGKQMLIYSLYATAATSLSIDLVDMLVQFQPMDPMLATIFGGVLLGGPLGLILLHGATTGGTDLLARLLKLKLPWLPMGKLLMIIDLVVIVGSAIVFHHVQSALYGLVALSIASFIMDTVLYGMDNAKVAYIISDHTEDLKQHITHEMQRGATVLHGHGAWSGEKKDVLLVAFKQRQIVPLKAAVKAIDPAAFLIVCNAHEVLGIGFGSYSETEL